MHLTPLSGNPFYLSLSLLKFPPYNIARKLLNHVLHTHP